MSEERSSRLADRLIEAEGDGGVESLHKGGAPTDPSFERLLVEDRKFEERVRRVALFAWALTLVCLVSIVVALTFAGPQEGSALDLARAVLALFGTVGMLSLLTAVVTSLSWLFRSRTPTLRAIERRLAALETLLMSRQ